MANKGGVGVSLVAKGTSLCFIGAHLNAHDERVERRNEDYIDERAPTGFGGRWLWHCG